MKIIVLITVLESLVVALWLLARRQSRNKRFHLAVGLNQSPILGDSPVIKLTANPTDAARWAFINEWHVDAQVDDRRPIWGSAAVSPGSPSSRRSIARRWHHARYKEWSARRSE